MNPNSFIKVSGVLLGLASAQPNLRFMTIVLMVNFFFFISCATNASTYEDCLRELGEEKEFIFNFSETNMMPQHNALWGAFSPLIQLFYGQQAVASMETHINLVTMSFGLQHISSPFVLFIQQQSGQYVHCMKGADEGHPGVDICCYYDPQPRKRQRPATNNKLKRMKQGYSVEEPMEIDQAIPGSLFLEIRG